MMMHFEYSTSHKVLYLICKNYVVPFEIKRYYSKNITHLVIRKV